jgi:hypothetical protein
VGIGRMPGTTNKMKVDYEQDWQFFPCTMGEYPALVTVDVGVAGVLEQTPDQMLMVTLELETSTESGLPEDDEFTALDDQEDLWVAELDKVGGYLIGRVTTDGRRTMYAYTSGGEEHWKDVGDRITAKFGYEYDVVVFQDENHESYHQGLYPSADDWRVIADMKVMNAANEAGDVASIVRKIDHWSYFADRTSAESFVEAAGAEGFELNDDPFRETEDGRVQVGCSHQGSLLLADLTHHTLWLRRKAEELGGNYDGWEAPVSKEEDPND